MIKIIKVEEYTEVPENIRFRPFDYGIICPKCGSEMKEIWLKHIEVEGVIYEGDIDYVNDETTHLDVVGSKCSNCYIEYEDKW